MQTPTRFPLNVTTTEYFDILDDENKSSLAVRAVAYALTPIVQQRLWKIEEEVAQRQLPVHHSFNAPLFSGTMTIPRGERDWHLMPLAEDPAWNHRHGFPMPKHVIEQLRKIEAANLDFDTLYIAHEAPKVAGYLPTPSERAVLLTPPVSSKARASAASMGVIAANLVKVAFAPALLAGAVGTAAATVAASALVGLDPIIFACVTDPKHGLKPGAPAAWLYLCHWNWE